MIWRAKSHGSGISANINVTNGGTHDAMAYTLPGIKTVVDLVDGVGRKVQVVFVIYNPLDVILGFHSSEFSSMYPEDIILYHLAVVMNFISHSGAFSLFPFSTFVLRWSIVFGFMGTPRSTG